MSKLRIGTRIIRIGAYSGVRHRKHQFANQPPSVPANLAATDIDSTFLTLSWDPATDDVAVTGYEYRVNSGAAVDVENLTSVVVPLLAAGTTYNFQVRAYDAQGARSAWSASIQATTLASQNQPPSSPANLVVSAITDTSLTLGWDASTDDVSVAGYEYRINSAPSVDVGLNLTANITGLSAGTSYDFQVRAYDGEGAFSAWSTVLTESTTGSQSASTFRVGYIENAAAGDPMLVSDTSPMGVSTFAAMVNSLTDINGNGFEIVPIQEAALLANVSATLSDIDILFVGSAIGDYTGTPATQLEAWVKAGGTFVCYSDNGLGGGADNGVGQVSRQSMGIRSWAGFDQARDQKDNVQTRTLPTGNFLAADMTTRQIQGEGMSPFVIDQDSANHPSQGYPTIILERPSQSLPKPLGLTFTGTVAELCYSRPGLGIFFGIMDRQLLLNGPNTGSDINQQENLQFLKNLLFCGSGAIAVPSNFDQEWEASLATMDTVFNMQVANYASGDLTVGTFNDQYPSQMNDWKNHLEGTRGPLLKVGVVAGRDMIELYRPKWLSGESDDVWFRKILGQSHPNPLFPQLGVGGDTVRHEYSFYFPLHALQGGGARGHICPKTVKMVGGPQGVTGVGNTGENPQPAGMYEFVPTVYNHKPYYSTPNAKGDWRNTVWDVNGDYGPAVTLDASSYQQLTHFGIASYLYDPRSAVVGHPFQEMFYILYWDENTQQLTNVRRPFKPDTLYDVRMEVVLNSRTEISPGVYNNGNNDGILRVWVREDNGPWLLGREETDMNIRGNGINTDYHPTEPVPFGDAGYIDFTGGSGRSYNLLPDSGLVSESTDSWFWFGNILMKVA